MKLKRLKPYLLLSALWMLFSCAQKADSGMMEMAAQEEAMPPTNTEEPLEVSKRKLIKEGYATFETENVNLVRKRIFESVEQYEGYVSSDQTYNASDRTGNTIIIRVPAANFDSLLLAATQGVEKFDSKEINVKDVTEDFLDVEARLKTKKELEIRYLELLKQAVKVSEILEIETQIGLLRTEIESIEGRLKYLQDKVSYATLTMTFYELLPEQTAFSKKFKQGFSNGWDNLIWFFVGLIHIWPFILIVAVILFGIRRYRKKNK